MGERTPISRISERWARKSAADRRHDVRMTLFIVGFVALIFWATFAPAGEEFFSWFAQ